LILEYSRAVDRGGSHRFRPRDVLWRVVADIAQRVDLVCPDTELSVQFACLTCGVKRAELRDVFVVASASARVLPAVFAVERVRQ
jgi:hypothetical protein